MALIFAVALGHIPTIDYYLGARWEKDPSLEGCIVTTRSGVDQAANRRGELTVIVRHAPIRWLRSLAFSSGSGCRCVMFMDDAQPGAWKCHDVPLLYGLRTSWRYWMSAPMVKRTCDQLWVSTQELCRRYPGAKLLPPRWFGPMPTCAPTNSMRWGYHGTHVHRRERAWLLPLVEEVQRRVPGAEFEIFGGRRLRRIFSHIPRVHVLSPRSWSDYLDYARSTPLAVGVAPLLPGPFNEARSHTKAFDIMRTGAVGIFSAREPYLSALQGSGAITLGDDHQDWAGQVERLLADPAERHSRFAQHLCWLQGQVARAGELQSLFEEN